MSWVPYIVGYTAGMTAAFSIAGGRHVALVIIVTTVFAIFFVTAWERLS